MDTRTIAMRSCSRGLVNRTKGTSYNTIDQSAKTLAEDQDRAQIGRDWRREVISAPGSASAKRRSPPR